VLRRVATGELADRALETAAAGLEPRDRAWAQELVYGTLRLRGRLDAVLDPLVRGGVVTLEPLVLDVLRLGAYQLLEMQSVPPYAAVSQSVELARSAGVGRASGLVNGVLQSLRRTGARPAFTLEQAPLEYLATWGSHPRWLLEGWLGRWGAEETAALVEANNRRPELYISPIGISVEEAAERLDAAGIGAEALAIFPGSLRIAPQAGVAEVLAAVPAVVQDPAAAAVVRYAAVPTGATVLDLCAAPGGKALGVAARAGYTAAADVSWSRLRRVRENASRLGEEHRLGVVVADARHPPFRPAAAVLLDVPCTGTGTLRRHPDGRWRLGVGDVEALTRLQRELLEAAAPLVEPGGLLVYSTCSLEMEENHDQVDAFLARHPEFRLEPETGAVAAELLDAEGRLEVLPQRTGVDGSFAARLRRTG
jgi:16S rRNA (cytosine967-C5)-methyltransferase